MNTKCYRCGTCCKGFIALVPKTKESDLSPEFLEEYGKTHTDEELFQYIEENSQDMGEVCPWLIEDTDDFCSCAVYEHRSSQCREYPGCDCKIGRMKNHKKGNNND